MTTFFQVVLLLMLIIDFLKWIYIAINGREKIQPLGFIGTIGFMLIFAAAFVIMYFAEAFDKLF